MKHGLYKTYKIAKCRCKPCTKANRDYMREYRARERAAHERWCVDIACYRCRIPRVQADPHGRVRKYNEGCRCEKCMSGLTRRNSVRRKHYARTVGKRVKPFRRGSVIALVSDICETYHWESWTVNRLAMEVSRIRKVPVPAIISAVRSARKRLVEDGVVLKGSVLVTGYEKDAPITREVMTIQWEDTA